MLVSCLMPIFNRLPHEQVLVEEAIQSFLYQDYAEKELIILNDTPGQFLEFNHPQVRVYNHSKRFPTLGEKLRFMISLSSGEALCRWDDDDISLPWRLSMSVERMGSGMEWRPENHWYVTPSDISETQHPGNTHVMSIWRKEIVSLIGGYPVTKSGAEDQAFNQKLISIGLPQRGTLLPPEDIFYLYRWGFSSVHLSGTNGDMQQFYDSLAERPRGYGFFKVEPKWIRDYTALPPVRGANRRTLLSGEGS